MAVRTFFGEPYSIPVELPSHINSLVDGLPNGSIYTADSFIDGHTTLPLYECFLGEEQRRRIRLMMRESGGAGIRTLLGIVSSGAKQLTFMRHCPACDEENRRVYGETYWHRLHQIAGIYVCPKHHAFLEESAAPRGIKARNIYLAAESMCPAKPARMITACQHSHEVLLKIATDAQWILSRKLAMPSIEAIEKGYRFLLSQKNLFSFAGSSKAAALLTKFSERYPAELLKQLDCELNQDVAIWRTWVCTMLQSKRKATPPVRHLLMINFLGKSSENFTDDLLNGRLQPGALFGSGPWSCLNELCSQRSKRTIKECSVENDKRLKHRVIGRFECRDCGFIYSRFGPDNTPHEELGEGWVTEYGAQWHEELKSGWMDSELNVVELAAVLGVTRRVVIRQATRWSLPFPKPCDVLSRCGSSPRRWKGRRSKVPPGVLVSQRSLWLDVLNCSPPKRSGHLSKEQRELRRWLNSHDYAWLTENSLAPQAVLYNRTPVVDWMERDTNVEKLIGPAVEKLMASPGRPTLISQLAICQEIDGPISLYGHRRKMPNFSSALQKAAETRSSWVIRILYWSHEQLKGTNRAVTKTNLALTAGVNIWKWLSHPEVRTTINSIVGE